MKGIPDLPKVPSNCHGNGGVMSGETPLGRGYPHHLPPTMPAPAQQRTMRHPPPSHQPWSPSPVAGMVSGFYGNPHLGSVRGSQWQPKPGNPLFGLSPVLMSQDMAAAQSESMDLSSTRPEPLRNGEKSPINGQLKETAVSVIAPNPLREEQTTIVPPKEEVSEAPLQDFSLHKEEKSAAPVIKEEEPVPATKEPSPPPAVEEEPVAVPPPPPPPPPQPSPPPPAAPQQSEPNEPPPETKETPTVAPVVVDGAPNDVDHVESLLENMFQGGEEAPIPQSVIVTNCTRQPVLTQDKVVAILEDKSPVLEEAPPVLPCPNPELPEVKPEKAESIEEELEVEVDSTVTEDEVKPEKLEEKSEPEAKNPYIQVETELEKMFAGIEEPTNEITPKPIVPDTKKTKRKSVAKPKTKKLSDGSETKKKTKKRVANEIDRKSKKVKLVGREKITKEGSNDSSLTTSRAKGPYIHIKGNKDNPSYVVVVNSGGKEEEERERANEKGVVVPRRKAQPHVEGRVKGPGLYSSTLSARYNSNNVDISWVCVFCKQRPHCELGLGGEPAGDLFGPYILRLVGEGPDFPPGTPTDKEVAEEQKRRGGGRQLSLRAAGVAQQFTNTMAKKSKHQQQQRWSDTSADQEIWVHEACAIWAPGVVLVGTHLLGLDEAVSAASVTKCSHCGETGAGLGCVIRGCATRCHYGCAVATHWSLNHDTFIAKCPNHKLSGGGFVTLGMLKGVPA